MQTPLINDPATKRKFLLLIGILLPVVFLLSLKQGAVDISWQDFFASFGFGQTPFHSTSSAILLELRLPRLLVVLIAGASLAVAGAVMQGLFRNALADPALLGVSSGGALAVVIVLATGLTSASWIALDVFFLPAIAFVGGIITTLFVYWVARRPEALDNLVLLLVGIAVNSLAAAGIGFITFVSSDTELRGFIFWMFGSFADIDWKYFFPAMLFMLPALIVLLRLSRALNALSLGDEDAIYLGFDTNRVKKIALASVSLCVCTSVAIAGIVGFAGLIVPHFLRLIIGADHRFLLPATVLSGALFLLLADNVARLALSPSEIPIGMLTAIVGVPFFILLVMKRYTKTL